MNSTKRFLLGFVLILGALFFFLDSAHGVTCKLELKRFEDKTSLILHNEEERILQRVKTQYLPWNQGRSMTPAFIKAVKKEPAVYESNTLYRGVIQFGSDQYGFVLDSSNLKRKGFNKLYFDRNLNGDLTDDPIIEARALPKGVHFGSGIILREFPRQDLTVNAGGKSYNYSFFLTVSSDERGSIRGSLHHARAYITPGAFRMGKVVLNGKTHSIRLLDFNSNGRFDDVTVIRDRVNKRTSRIYYTPGDRLLLDFNPKNADPSYSNLTGRDDRVPVAKLLFVDGNYYEMMVSPSGDSIELTPSTAPTRFYSELKRSV